MRLRNKVAIVTGAGGAGVGGLGVVYARALASEGASVIVNDIDEGAADAVAAAIVADGGRSSGVGGDVADESDAEAMVDTACREFGGVDILVNNAGLARDKWNDALALPVTDWERIFAVNTLGPLLCARACRPSMVERGGGAIVNQTSMGAYGDTGAYTVTKLALVGMTKVLSAELGPDNIRVNAIAPGMMTAQLPPEMVETLLATQKLGRPGRPEDLVGALVFLCSDESDFMTGQTLIVDGGSTRGHV